MDIKYQIKLISRQWMYIQGFFKKIVSLLPSCYDLLYLFHLMEYLFHECSFSSQVKHVLHFARS